MELENVDDCASAKEEQNPKDPIVAEASPTLEPLIDKLDFDNKDSLHLEKIIPRRNRIERLLKLMEANPQVQLNYSTKMLQLSEAFSVSAQPSTKVNLVTLLKDFQQTSKTIYPEYKFTLTSCFLFQPLKTKCLPTN